MQMGFVFVLKMLQDECNRDCKSWLLSM